jgi:hypothetical protein
LSASAKPALSDEVRWPSHFGLQRSGQIDMQNVGRRTQSFSIVFKVYELHDYVMAGHQVGGVVVWIILVIKRIIEHSPTSTGRK